MKDKEYNIAEVLVVYSIIWKMRMTAHC